MSAADLEDLPLDEEEGEFEPLEQEEEPEVYFTEDFISGPRLSANATLPGDILDFDFSYGYDCKRYYNIVVADEHTLIFASGNLINFFDTRTRELWFRRSAFGGGIGHITKNPNQDFPHIAVAENGIKPPIILYDWPSLEIVKLLKQGTSRCYTHLNYSPDGMLLASQGGEPDYMITLFNWTKGRILLRAKSYVNEIFRVMFAPDVPGQLTSCGITHIKFWKMAQTFTGLKLKGELGRFGKTEYCDILGLYPMPDEKVVSGCKWGNMLIWDEGLIKFEVRRKLNRTCHEDEIMQFYFKDNELWSIAADGRVRVWNYETIDQADPPDDYRYVEVEPTYDFAFPGVELMCIFKVHAGKEDETFYYAQDGNGGFWKIDLNVERPPEPAEQLYRCHAGPIADIAACPWGPYLISLGADGRIQIYNYLERTLLYRHQFPAKGTCMIWIPVQVQNAGNELIMGFDDGQLRLVIVNISEEPDNPTTSTTIQVTKPHNKPITKMILSNTGNVLVTGGEDSTIFIFQTQTERRSYTHLIPVGYIRMPAIITYLTWHHIKPNTVVVGCMYGHFAQVEIPTVPQEYTTITYILHITPMFNRFTTYKAQIRRDIKIAEIEAQKAEKLAIKQEKLDQLKKDNPGMDIDEELFLADSESEEELEPLHIPEIPNPVLWLQTTDEGTIWLSMGGYDAGYIYEYEIDQTSEIPTKFQIIYDGDDIEISGFVYNRNRKYIIFAMQSGSIKVVKRNPEDWRDFSDYWELSMHDNYNGFVPKMCFSYDEKYFFTCGRDGNVFSYKFYPEYEEKHVAAPKISSLKTPQEVPDLDGYTKLSLEEAIVKAEEDRIAFVANQNKKILRDKLKVLKDEFEALLHRNDNLPQTQVIPREEFELDPRITEDLEATFAADLALVERKLSFDVEKSLVAMTKLKNQFTDPVDQLPICITGIQEEISVRTTRQRKLPPGFHEMMELIEQKIIEDELKGRPPERPPVVLEAPKAVEKGERPLEYFLVGLSPSIIERKLGAQLTRLLRKYRTRKIRNERRQEQWEQFKAKKPAEGVNDPTDENALSIAIATIGDYKLKSATNYKVTRELRESTVKKYKQLLTHRFEQYNIRRNFNMKVYEMRRRKVELIKQLTDLTCDLEYIHKELKEDNRKFGPPIPPLDPENFPEKNLEVVIILPPELTPQEPPQQKIIRLPKGDVLEEEILEHPEEITEILSTCVDTDTPWEAEVRAYRTSRKLIEQDLIISKMQREIEKFDHDLKLLYEERIYVLVEASFLDVHIINTHQELIILKKFEAVEEQLQEKVNCKILEMLDMQDLISEIYNRIDHSNREILALQENEKELQSKFFTAAGDNKFYDFLRRIFKKKYKPPKVKTDDDDESSESSSSSSSSEEADEGSVDSRDFGIIRLDENICPKGCDQALYNLTFDLRTQRHGVELKIRDYQAEIVQCKRDIEINSKKMKIIDSQLNINQSELEAYQREKQQKLNEIYCTVIMKRHQMQHLASPSQANRIPDTLIFAQQTLSKLYKRVGELQRETLAIRNRHRSNITHLCRMKTDCKSMKKTISALQEEIIETQKIKFGQEVDIDELEETQLKSMVRALRMTTVDFKKMFRDELDSWKDEYIKKQKRYIAVMNENTARMELVAAINKEKKELTQIVARQAKKREHIENVVDISVTYKDDIKRMEDIIKDQNRELQALRDEIKRLRMKDTPPTRDRGALTEEGEHEVDDFPWHDWDYAIPSEPSAEPCDAEPKDAPPSIPSKPEERPISKQVQIPKVFVEDTEAIIRGLVNEMMDAMDTYRHVAKHVVKGLAEQIVQNVIGRKSIAEITETLLAYLPEDPTPKQEGIIETTAEHIFALQKEGDWPEPDRETVERRILNEIIDRAMQDIGPPIDLITKIISDAVEKLSVNFLTKRKIIGSIINRISDYISPSDLDKYELAKSVLSVESTHMTEIRQVLDGILEIVFGTGIDYLYFIK